MALPELLEQRGINPDKNIFKVSFLLAYDYDYLKTSIPLIYNEANSIVLAKDVSCRTWSGNTFEIDPSFFEWIEAIDNDKKIFIYEDDFYNAKLSQLENDTRERNMIAAFLGAGGWHIQLDADEYFVNFLSFTKYLNSISYLLKEPQKKPVAICLDFHTLFKQLPDGFLYTVGIPQIYPVATNWPQYVACRTVKGIHLFSGYNMIHHSWARKEDEMKTKLLNWTHKNDFDTKSYFSMWQAIDKNNYKYLRDFHPMIKQYWDRLELIPAKNLEEIVKKFAENYKSKPRGILFSLKQNYLLKSTIQKFKAIFS